MLKRDFEILEQLKVLANDSFSISNQSDSLTFKQQRHVLQCQLDCVDSHQRKDNLHESTQHVLVQYREALQAKISELDAMVQLEKGYLSTLPLKITKQ